MEQQEHFTNQHGGKHFTWEDRLRLETLTRAFYPRVKPNFADLGQRLGRHRSSVSREWRRGQTVNYDSELLTFPVYSAHKGQDAANSMALNKGPRGKLTTSVAKAIAELIIKERLSPYAAVVKLKAQGALPWVPCERSVYYAIDAGMIGVTREQLPYKRPAGKRRVKTGKRMAYTNIKGRPITERPPGAENRSEYGHWEMDTVVGGRGNSPACLLVLTERMTRYTVIRKLSARTQRAVIREFDYLERSGHKLFQEMKTITCDNGCEFLNFMDIEKSATKTGERCRVYFAHPFCAAERGSNENANRIVRRFIPKGSNIAKFTRKQIQKIESWIARLPRKILDGLSAEEKIKAYLKENTA